MTTTDRNDPCPCGSTKKFKHCCQRKEKTQKAKLHPDAATVPTWLNLALQHLQAGRPLQAKAIYEQILQVNPRQADALQWLGVVYHQQGDNERAIALIQQAITQKPGNAFFYGTLGNVLQAADRGSAAISSYRHALRIKPDFAEALNNLGIALCASGELNQAIESYSKAIVLLPNYAQAHNNMGIALEASNLPDEAATAYQKALTISPNYAQALFNYGRLLQKRNPDHAVEFFRRALLLKPDYTEAWLALGNLLRYQCKLDQASASFQRVIALQPKLSNGVVVRNALMLPPIMGTRDELLASRARFEKKLDKLIIDQVTLRDPARELVTTNFYLAYHGLNDRDIQKKIAYFYKQACPSLMYVASHCGQTRHTGQKIRVGFLSEYISSHPVSLCFSRIVEALAIHVDFEVTLLSNNDLPEKIAGKPYSQFDGSFFRFSDDLTQAREQIAALKLDVLVYLDIGMSPLTYFLAFSRLASVQCVLGGHPVTTGIGALDYFISSELAESADADSHYSEKLVRLPFGAFYFERPVLPTFVTTRQQLGLPEKGTIYVCPMVLHKIHPDFDEAIARVLQLDTQGHVVLFADGKYSSWQIMLESRFVQTIPEEVRDRVIFLPWVTDSLDFIRISEAADVILDPFHFGIGSTAIATCSVGTPFVTKPSEFMRGRVGLFYCKLMDLMECVALDTEDYARKAVAIATDHTLRETIKAKMLKNNHVLFENKQAITDVTGFFLEIGGRL